MSEQARVGNVELKLGELKLGALDTSNESDAFSRALADIPETVLAKAGPTSTKLTSASDIKDKGALYQQSENPEYPHHASGPASDSAQNEDGGGTAQTVDRSLIFDENSKVYVPVKGPIDSSVAGDAAGALAGVSSTTSDIGTGAGTALASSLGTGAGTEGGTGAGMGTQPSSFDTAGAGQIEGRGTGGTVGSGLPIRDQNEALPDYESDAKSADQ